MKKEHPYKCLALVSVASLACMGLVSCGTEDQTDRSSGQAAAVGHNDSDDQSPLSKPPRVGMTQAEVRGRYGDPDAVSMTPHGEMWSYAEASRASGLKAALLPGYGLSAIGQKGHHLFIVFDEAGRVKTYHATTTKSQGEKFFNS